MSLSGASRKGLWSGVGGGEESSGWGTGEVSRAGPDSEGTGMLWKEFVHYMNPSGLSVPFDLGSTGARVCACHGCCEAQWSRGCLSWPWGSSGPAPWSYPPGHRRLLCLQTETHSWPQPPWTQCWLASRGPGAPLALQVSAEGSCTAWSAWSTCSGLGLSQGALCGRLGNHGLGRILGIGRGPLLLGDSTLVGLDTRAPNVSACCLHEATQGCSLVGPSGGCARVRGGPGPEVSTGTGSAQGWPQGLVGQVQAIWQKPGALEQGMALGF